MVGDFVTLDRVAGEIYFKDQSAKSSARNQDSETTSFGFGNTLKFSVKSFSFQSPFCAPIPVQLLDGTVCFLLINRVDSDLPCGFRRCRGAISVIVSISPNIRRLFKTVQSKAAPYKCFSDLCIFVNGVINRVERFQNIEWCCGKHLPMLLRHCVERLPSSVCDVIMCLIAVPANTMFSSSIYRNLYIFFFGVIHRIYVPAF